MKDDGFEDRDLGAFFPGFSVKPGFQAALGQEFFPVPLILDGDLRQEKSSLTSPGYDQSVFSHLDEPGIVDFPDRGEHGDFVG